MKLTSLKYFGEKSNEPAGLEGFYRRKTAYKGPFFTYACFIIPKMY